MHAYTGVLLFGNYSKLKSQWDEKMEMLGRLEQSMADVQASFKEKEAILMKERDEAVENSRYGEDDVTVTSSFIALVHVLNCWLQVM